MREAAQQMIRVGARAYLPVTVKQIFPGGPEPKAGVELPGGDYRLVPVRDLKRPVGHPRK